MTASRHHGRMVLITGAGSGIGAAIASQYAEEGAVLALVDVDQKAVLAKAVELRQGGARVATGVADVSDFASCQEIHQHLISELGGDFDTLINNAGISPKTNGKPTDFWKMDPQEWQRVVGVNLNGAFNWTRLVAPSMVQAHFGRVVNMSSVAAKSFVSFTGAHYGTSKAALIGLTRDLAGELGPHGITVNAVAPGRIDTPLMRGAATSTNEAVVLQTPLGRLGLSSEVAEVVCFLTGSESSFVTGQVVDVAGGWLMT